MKRIFILILLIAVLGSGWVIFKRSHKDISNASSAVPVSVVMVERRDIPLEIHEVGNVAAYETVAVRSRLDSQVMEVHFKDGDFVRKGDLLFVLDGRMLKAQANQLEANIRRDKAQLQNLRQQYERSKELTAKGFESAANLDDAKAAYESQRATLGASDAALSSLKVQLGYTRITSPISGRTGTINITVGNTVKANDTQALVTINRIKPIRVQIALSQQYFDTLQKAIKEGTVEVLATRQGQKTLLPGKLEYIDNAVDQATGTFITRAIFENDDKQLWPGMFVTLTLKLGNETGALTVPEVAVQRGQASDYVFVVEKNKAMRRDVKMSRVQDGVAVISSGLKEGELVTTDGMFALKDGALVVVRSPALKK